MLRCLVWEIDLESQSSRARRPSIWPGGPSNKIAWGKARNADRQGKARNEGGRGGETAALGNRCLQRKGRADWRNLLGRDIFRTGTCSDYTAKAFSVSSLAFDSRYPCGGSHSLPFAEVAFQLSVNPSGDCKKITFSIARAKKRLSNFRNGPL